MWHPRAIMDLRFPIFCLLIAAEISLALRDVRVTVPTAVRKGGSAHLICNYDMENDTLYSVKWYKGRREFYRYTPKENPAMKTFFQQGITVERSLSNKSHVFLTSLEPAVSGKFSCEVSADAPSFHTMIVSGELEVVELPVDKPTISGIHTRYRVSDTLVGNCTSPSSKPAANLTWTINDVQATPKQVKSFANIKNLTNNLASSVLQITVDLTPSVFNQGKLKLKCSARIHEIYEEEVEKLVEEDKPRIMASGKFDTTYFQHSYDQPQDDDNASSAVSITGSSRHMLVLSMLSAVCVIARCWRWSFQQTHVNAFTS